MSIHISNAVESVMLSSDLETPDHTHAFSVGFVDADQNWRELIYHVLDCGTKPFVYFLLEGHISHP